MKGLIFTYLLTYGGAAVALFNPFVGLLVYCSFAIIRPEAMWPWAVPQQGYYARTIAICLLLGWVLRGLGDWNFGRAHKIVVALLAYFAWAAASTLAASYPTDWTFIENASKYVLPWVVGITTISSMREVRTLAWVLMLSQAYVAYEQNLIWVFGNREAITYGFGGMDNNCNAIAMVTGAGLAFFLGMTTPNTKLRWLSFVCAGLMAHYPMFAQSRGGMVALVVVGLVSFLLLPKKPRYIAYFGLAIVAGIRLAGPSVWDRFNTSFEGEGSLDESAQSRLDLWRDAWDMIQRYPLFGVGPDNFPVVAREYGWAGAKECHSLWMQTAAELGLPGIALLLSFYGLSIVGLWRYSRTIAATDPWETCFARAVIASLIGFGVAAQFVTLEGLELPYYVALVGAAVLKLGPKPVAPPMLSEFPS